MDNEPQNFRPNEVEALLGDSSKAKEKLKWEPKISVEEMCAEMVSADLRAAKRDVLLKNHGHDIPLSVE